MEYYACKITFELIDLFLLSTLCYIEKGCKWRTNFYAIIWIFFWSKTRFSIEKSCEFLILPRYFGIQKLQSWNVTRESWAKHFCTKNLCMNCWWNQPMASPRDSNRRVWVRPSQCFLNPILKSEEWGHFQRRCFGPTVFGSTSEQPVERWQEKFCSCHFWRPNNGKLCVLMLPVQLIGGCQLPRGFEFFDPCIDQLCGRNYLLTSSVWYWHAWGKPISRGLWPLIRPWPPRLMLRRRSPCRKGNLIHRPFSRSFCRVHRCERFSDMSVKNSANPSIPERKRCREPVTQGRPRGLWLLPRGDLHLHDSLLSFSGDSVMKNIT